MKTAIVTGAYKGLGFEWCKQLGLSGYKVILTARSLNKAIEASKFLLASGINIIPKQLDIANEEEIKNLANEIEKEFGVIDMIVNNAGINSKDSEDKDLFMKSFRLSDLDASEVLRHIHINSIAPILMVKHFKKLLLKAQKPVVINISSWLGSIEKKTTGGHYSYTTSKAALNMMNKALALEIKNDGIISVVVNPGWVKTDMGGANANLTTEESVKGMINNILNKIEINDTGKFFQWDGSQHPW